MRGVISSTPEAPAPCRQAWPLLSLSCTPARDVIQLLHEESHRTIARATGGGHWAESRGRKVSKSDVVRERLERAPRQRRRTASLTAIADLIGSVDGLPTDLTTRKKEYLQAKGYGQKRPR